jgi:hypothetical protein
VDGEVEVELVRSDNKLSGDVVDPQDEVTGRTRRASATG